MWTQIFILALSALAMASATTSTVEPSVVHVLVTSTITVLPSQTSVPGYDLQARQWGPAPSAPAWTEPAKSWVEQPWVPETQPAWVPTSAAAPWTPTYAPSNVATSIPTGGSNPSNHPLPKGTLANGIIFGVVIGSLCAVGFIGVLITVIRRKCATRRVKPASRDVEMTAGLFGDGSTPSSLVTSTQTMDSSSFESTPVRNHSIIETPRSTYYPPQATHWPPEEVEMQTVGWARGRGYGAMG